MTTEAVPVQEALRRVTADVGAIGKNRQIEEGPAKYAYRGIDDILEAVHPLLAEHGVVIAPRVVERVHEPRTTRNGGAALWVVLTVEWTVVGPDGSRLEPAPATCGEALDYSDKAHNKAHTAAFKTLLSQLFAIAYSEVDQDDSRIELGHRGQSGATGRAGGRTGNDSGRAGSGQQRATQPAVTADVPPPPDPADLPDPDGIAALWEHATADEQAEAEALAQLWENLPADLFDKVNERMAAKVAGAATLIDPAWVAALPPSWLPVWRAVIGKAWEAANQR